MTRQNPDQPTEHRSLTRRAAMAGGVGLTLAAPALARSAAAIVEEPVIVMTAGGKLRGVRRGDVHVYRGIPYGGDVSGPRRFLPAKPAAPWTGVRDASRLGAPSLQPAGGSFGVDEPASAENCLFLNVWAPAGGAARKPVMFYSHGGAFSSGSGGGQTQDGANLAREHDVVVVASNHRLGLLGYLYLGELGGEAYGASGNQGLSDILLALRWVAANIEAFGGDPDNVMIFGESGGGAKTSCLYAMPAAAPHFAKAAIQSGPAVRIGQRDVAAQTTRMVLAELGMGPGDWRRLLEVPGDAILGAQASLAAKHPDAPGGSRGIADFRPGGYGPILDPERLPNHPFDPAAPASAADKPLITGWIDSEANFFAWKMNQFAAFSLDEAQMRALMARDFGPAAPVLLQAYRKDRPRATPSELYLAARSAPIMGLGSLAIAERKAAQQRAPVYYYNLAYRSNMKLPGGAEAGAMHAIDIPLVFDNAGPTTTLLGDRPDRLAAARNMSSLWANFARTSVPSAPGQPAWRPYSPQDRATMVIDAECRMVSDRHRDERLAWRAIGF
jgi:para-nitrobenzyl esterase